MSKKQSRTDRWNEAVTAVREAHSALGEAFSALRDLQGEFQEWRDSLPESGGSDATREKLEAICDLDLDTAVDDLDDVISECENVEVPLGFGRD